MSGMTSFGTYQRILISGITQGCSSQLYTLHIIYPNSSRLHATLLLLIAPTDQDMSEDVQREGKKPSTRQVGRHRPKSIIIIGMVGCANLLLLLLYYQLVFVTRTHVQVALSTLPTTTTVLYSGVASQQQSLYDDSIQYCTGESEVRNETENTVWHKYGYGFYSFLQ